MITTFKDWLNESNGTEHFDSETAWKEAVRHLKTKKAQDDKTVLAYDEDTFEIVGKWFEDKKKGELYDKPTENLDMYEDFSQIGVAPEGNMGGTMGNPTAPTSTSTGSGDAWPSLGAPYSLVPLPKPKKSKLICNMCGKTKKRCKCKK